MWRAFYSILSAKLLNSDEKSTQFSLQIYSILTRNLLNSLNHSAIGEVRNKWRSVGTHGSDADHRCVRRCVRCIKARCRPAF